MQIFATNQCLPFVIVTKKIVMEIPTPEFTTDNQIRNLKNTQKLSQFLTKQLTMYKRHYSTIVLETKKGTIVQGV